MELEQLRQVLKIAERKNFTRAAEELLLSQPALSRSIARLEEELGQPLFERRTRSVELTDAGRSLVSRAERILALVDDAKAEIADDGETGTIRVGAIPTVAPYCLPQALRGFAQTCPKASLLVTEEVTERLLDKCREGQVDVGLLALPISARHLEVEALFEEELLLILPPDHPLAEKKRIGIEDLQTYPFVLLDEAHCLTDSVVSFCRRKSFQPLAVERTSQLATVQELVSLGHGVSLIPAMARAVDASDRRIYRSLSGIKPTRTLAMVWNPYRFQSKLLDRFKRHLRETLCRKPEPAKRS
jgi:LysR family hydrogen peroxide-inducible transcriptional activator